MSDDQTDNADQKSIADLMRGQSAKYRGGMIIIQSIVVVGAANAMTDALIDMAKVVAKVGTVDHSKVRALIAATQKTIRTLNEYNEILSTELEHVEGE